MQNDLNTISDIGAFEIIMPGCETRQKEIDGQLYFISKETLYNAPSKYITRYYIKDYGPMNMNSTKLSYYDKTFVLHRHNGPAHIAKYSNYFSVYYYHGELCLDKAEWFEKLTPEEKKQAAFNLDEGNYG